MRWRATWCATAIVRGVLVVAALAGGELPAPGDVTKPPRAERVRLLSTISTGAPTPRTTGLWGRLVAAVVAGAIDGRLVRARSERELLFAPRSDWATEGAQEFLIDLDEVRSASSRRYLLGRRLVVSLGTATGDSLWFTSPASNPAMRQLVTSASSARGDGSSGVGARVAECGVLRHS